VPRATRWCIAITPAATGTAPNASRNAPSSGGRTNRPYYFLLTFTLPAALRPIARRHQRLIYDQLFRAAAAATQQLACHPRFIGGQIGMVGVLHTWTRDLRYHPYVHFLMPTGGLSADGRTWYPTLREFLLPVRALSRLFRGIFRQAVRSTPAGAEIPSAVWTQAWVVHCQSVGTGETALKYLAPYIYRVALSNRRLVKLDHDCVTFRYRTSSTGETKFCTLPVEAFLHRLLQHVLPKGFVKVHAYGIFAPGHRRRLAALRQQLQRANPQPTVPTEPAPVDPALHVVNAGRSHPDLRCPICGQVMAVQVLARATGRGPPGRGCRPAWPPAPQPMHGRRGTASVVLRRVQPGHGGTRAAPNWPDSASETVRASVRWLRDEAKTQSGARISLAAHDPRQRASPFPGLNFQVGSPLPDRPSALGLVNSGLCGGGAPSAVSSLHGLRAASSLNR
jgi:putative transposase